MPSYRRWHVEGGLYFFTLVTHHRREICSSPRARRLLRKSIDSVRKLHPFELYAEDWCGHVEFAGVDIEPDTW